MPYSQRHADRACNFFEKILKHTADEWWGKPFMLAPWQEEAIAEIFGRLDAQGNRIIQLAYLEVPKKTGKTEVAAGLVLLVLALDPNPGCQVYGAAAATRQAMNVYRAACKMVEQSPLLQSRMRVLRGTNRIIKRDDPDSFYAAVAADGDLSDGVNPSFVVCDELHRWRTRKQLENWDVLSMGGVARQQTLTIAITTAGVRSESPLAWRLHEKTRRIQEGVVADAAFYGRIYAADKKEDWTSEQTWIKANPSLKENGGFLDIAKLRKEYQSSLSEPERQRAFRRYFLNLWDEKDDRAIPMIKWDACAAPWKACGLLPVAPSACFSCNEPAEHKEHAANNKDRHDFAQDVRWLPPELMKRFAKRKCWAGVDLSMTTDITACAFVFPDDEDDQAFDVLPFFWMPEDGLHKREVRDGMPYRTWAEQGWMELSPGNVIDYREVQARLEWGDRHFQLQEILFDPWNSRQISVPMAEAGYSVLEVRQGFATLNEPSKKLLNAVLAGKLRHGGHPILRFHASCVVANEKNDNLMFRKPERAKDSARIDGISATVNALTRAMLDEGGSVYDNRGVLTL